MVRRVNVNALIYEDVEWVDPAGRSWFVAGDIEVEKVLPVVAIIQRMQRVGKKGKGERAEDMVQLLLDLMKAIRGMFATRHTPKEMLEFKVGAPQMMPLVLELLRLLVADLVSAEAVAQVEAKGEA